MRKKEDGINVDVMSLLTKEAGVGQVIQKRSKFFKVGRNFTFGSFDSFGLAFFPDGNFQG